MQQVNLYLPEFRPNRAPVRAQQMLWISLGFIALLLVASFYSARTNRALSQQLLQSQQQLDSLKLQLDQLIKAQPKVNLAKLDEQILKLNTQYQHRLQLQNLATTNDLGNSRGFSEQLAAMSRQSLDTVSLQAFSLARGGRYAELAGTTLASDQIPLYIQRLRTEPSFQSVAFGVLQVAPLSASLPLLRFSLAANKPADASSVKTQSAVQRLLELNAKAVQP